MNIVWRLLGLQLLAELGARLPLQRLRVLTLAVLVAVNLMPLVAVVAGWIGVANVFAVYLLELAVLGAFTVLKILTCTAPSPKWGEQGPVVHVLNAVFFLFHFGMATAVMGAFIWAVAHLVEVELFEGALIGWLVAALALSHAVHLVVYWFGRGERHYWTIDRTVLWPYPHLGALFLTITLGGFALLLIPHRLTLVVLLVTLKIAGDLLLDTLERRHAARVGELSIAAQCRSQRPQPLA